MGGQIPELPLEQVPPDESTKRLSECLKRIGDELDSNVELQRCAPLGCVWGEPRNPSPTPWGATSHSRVLKPSRVPW